MAKDATKKYVPSQSNPAKTAERIVRLLDESRAVTNMHTYEHYRRTLNIWHAALTLAKMAPWLEVCAGMERGLGPLQQALGLLMAEAMYNYEDVIGSVYMLLSQGEKRLGQYFTPYPVARMMARMNLGDLKPREEGAPPIRILEPCCGSGVMILACAEEIETRYPGMILRGDVLFYGIDLDSLCVTMCQINMLLHGIGHMAHVPDDEGEQEQTSTAGPMGRAPRDVFQPAQIVCGNSLTQDTAELFAQEPPWIPVTLVLPQTAEAKLAGEAEEDSVVRGQGKTEVQASPDAVEAEEQRQVADGTVAQILSVEEDPPMETTLSDQPAEGEQEIRDLVQDTPEKILLELDAPELPMLPPVTAATSSSEKKPEQDATQAREEDLSSAPSEETSGEQVGDLAWQDVPLGQCVKRRKRHRKDDSDVVIQQSFFS